MLASLARALVAALAFLHKRPWISWGAWDIFVLVAIARIDPRRFGSTFGAYLEAGERLWRGELAYNPLTLGDFLYFPISLLIYVPFGKLDPVLAATIALTIDAAFFTWACVVIVPALLPAFLPGNGRPDDALALAGGILLLNIPAAWFNFKGIQAQVPMTAAMIAAGAAMMHERWKIASFWLFIAILMKPLALVMVLLCGALMREMRLPLIIAIGTLLLLPFAFLDWGYLVEQYWFMGRKLWRIAAEPPGRWLYQADFTTMLHALGIDLPWVAALVARVAAALGTLVLAWRVRVAGGSRSFALAVLLLSACYVTLFGPRNEFLSFIVLTPSLAVLAALMLVRDDSDYRGWSLIAAALALGISWGLAIDRTLKPAIVVAIYVWLAWMMAIPGRWREMVEGSEPVRSGAAGCTEASAEVAGHR